MKKKGMLGKRNGKNVFGRIRGYLTKDDIAILDEASKRVYKHAKNPAKHYQCGECEYHWLYLSMKCPVCSSVQIKQVA